MLLGPIGDTNPTLNQSSKSVFDRSIEITLFVSHILRLEGRDLISKDIASQLTSTVGEWRIKLLELDQTTARHKPSADRWSIAEVLGHLVDSACNNHQRFVRAQESDALTFPKYNQNTWVSASDYQHCDWPQLVELWSLYNYHIAHVMRNIPERSLQTPCTITPYETCTLEFLVTDYLDHLYHHLKKIGERF